MSVQTITRQEILSKAVEVIKNLPDNRLQQVWKQVNTWALTISELVDDKINRNYSSDSEVLEFEVTSRSVVQNQFIRLPIRSEEPITMAKMEIGESGQTTSNIAQKLQVNIEWWNQNCDKIVNNSSLHHRYVAISDGEFFSGDSYLEAYNKTHEMHADGFPYIFYLNPAKNKVHHTN